VEAYERPPSPEEGVSSAEFASVYVPGHVQPGPAKFPEASKDNGLLSGWHPNDTDQTMSIPVKQPATYEPTFAGGNIKAPSKFETIDVESDQSYQIRAVGLEPVGTQQMVTPNGQPVTRVDYQYQYEVRKRTTLTFNGIGGWRETDWEPVSTEEAGNLVGRNHLAESSLPGWQATDNSRPLDPPQDPAPDSDGGGSGSW
jgi:hypothetical protein